MIIVKFGGSVITNKAVEKTLDKANLARVSGELAGIDEELIVVHGAGSFGHVRAKKYELDKGYLNDEQSTGLAIVQRDVRELNLAVMNALIGAGINCASIAPSSVLRQDEGNIYMFDDGVFEDCLALGLTPVSFGDVVLDDTMRFSICSGDALMTSLATAFKPRLAIFVADVDGIFRDIEDAGSLIERIKFDQIDELIESVGGSAGIDVTGGMKFKLEMIKSICENGTDTIVLNGREAGRLAGAISGSPQKLTLVEGKKSS